MKKHKISAIISFCSNDYRFLKRCISELKQFADEVLVVTCSHFFNGTKENRNLLNLAYFENPDIQFIEFKYYKKKLYSPYITAKPNTKEHRHLWHSISRYIGFFYLKNPKYILFVDSDEIFEAEKFKLWLNKFPYQNYSAFRLASFYYFRKSTFRAKKYVKNGLMVEKEKLSPIHLLKEGERYQTFYAIPERKHPLALGIDKKPMVHHYSWVRPKHEMIQKTNWGHHFDKNWKKLIEKEFKDPQKRDFFLNLELEEVKSYFDPLKVEINLNKKIPKTFKNVKKISYADILEKELERVLK